MSPLPSQHTRSALVAIPLVLGLLAVGAWLVPSNGPELTVRVPIPANDPPPPTESEDENANPGTLTTGAAKPSADQGSWPQFRGANRDAISTGTRIAEAWPQTGPRKLWEIELGEGHAGVAIHAGAVYLVDYDEEAKETVIRSLSLDEGEEIWRYSYSSKIKRNHGMSRTVPAVNDNYLVSLGPKCQVVCLRPASGELVWKKNLIEEYGTRVPEWYAGQCPLIEEDRVILAPGGRCLMTAIDLATGEAIWETTHEEQWDMTHTSIVPIEFEGERQYVWAASGGALGVSAKDGKLLWTYPDWKIKIANVPSPLDLGGGKIFLSGGYNAGASLLQIVRSATEASGFGVELLYHTEPEVFGSDQQTPVLVDGHIYGVIPGGKPACLSLDGERLWEDDTYNFGLGPYTVIDGKLLILDDNGKKPGELCLFKITPEGPTRLAGHKILHGHDAWAPMAFAGGKLIVRDSTTMICIQISDLEAS